MKQYYYIDKNGQQQGPVEINELIKSGITRNTKVWKQGMADWQEANALPELSDLLPPGISNVPPSPPNNNPANSNKKNAVSFGILLLISGVLTLFLSLISRFIYAFIASVFNTKPIEFPTVAVIAVSVLIIIATFIMKNFRRHWRMVLCFVVPFLISSIIALCIFLSINVNSPEYGYFETGNYYNYGEHGVMNKFGIQIIPKKYNHIDFSSPVEIIGCRGHKTYKETGKYCGFRCREIEHYNYIDHFDLKGNFLYSSSTREDTVTEREETKYDNNSSESNSNKDNSYSDYGNNHRNSTGTSFTCGICNGIGRITCYSCNGEGHPPPAANEIYAHLFRVCSTCNGEKTLVCGRCAGSGKINTP